jgi:hypothetical protein
MIANTHLAISIIICVGIILVFFIKLRSISERFGAMQEYIYIPPQMDMGQPSASVGFAPATVLGGGVTVQTMGPMGDIGQMGPMGQMSPLSPTGLYSIPMGTVGMMGGPMMGGPMMGGPMMGGPMMGGPMGPMSPTGLYTFPS